MCFFLKKTKMKSIAEEDEEWDLSFETNSPEESSSSTFLWYAIQNQKEWEKRMKQYPNDTNDTMDVLFYRTVDVINHLRYDREIKPLIQGALLDCSFVWCLKFIVNEANSDIFDNIKNIEQVANRARTILDGIHSLLKQKL